MISNLKSMLSMMIPKSSFLHICKPKTADPAFQHCPLILFAMNKLTPSTLLTKDVLKLRMLACSNSSR